MKFKLALALLTVLPSLTMAENVYDAQFQQIQEIELVEIVETENGVEEVVVQRQKVPAFLDQFSKNGTVQKVNVGEIVMMTKKLIALGKEVYKIVEAGKPVINIDSKPIDVLPRAEGGEAIQAMQLHSWSAPKVKKYKVGVKNYLGINTASLEVMLIFTYGGQNNGQGRYITGAQIKPTKVNVKWGWKLNAEFKLQTIVNQGSVDSPVAGAVLMLDYDISTVLQSSKDNYTFFINGLGDIQNY